LDSKRKTILQIIILLILATYVLGKGLWGGWTRIDRDFPNYYVSATSILTGNDVKKLYDDIWFQQQIDSLGIETRGKFSPQPPIIAAVMLPIAHFKPMIAKRIWLVLNVLFLILAVLLIPKVFKVNYLEAALAMMIGGRALINDFTFGQLYTFILLGMLLSLWLMKQEKYHYPAGAIIALLAMLKYLPIVLILLALLNRKMKVVYAAFITVPVLIFLQYLFFGTEFMNFYFFDILPAHLSGDIPGQGGFAIAFQSWPSFYNNIFVLHPKFNSDPLIDWSSGKTIMIIITYLAVLCTSSWFIVRLLNSGKNLNRNAYELMLMLILTSTLLLLPASATYHFLFLTIPFVIVLGQEKNWSKWLLLTMIFCINFLPYPFAEKSNLFVLLLSYPRLIGLTIVMVCAYLVTSSYLKYNSENYG